MKITIRKESEPDFSAIQELNKLAFGQDNESNLIDALRKGQSFIPGLSLVALYENKIVGHILFTKIKIIDLNQIHESLALAPIAVIPQFQKQGIGGLLIKHGLARAADLGFKSVIVLGHEHYYPKFGFFPTSKWGIKSPFNVPENVFMGIELIKDGLKNVRGTVKYPIEFESV